MANSGNADEVAASRMCDIARAMSPAEQGGVITGISDERLWEEIERRFRVAREAFDGVIASMGGNPGNEREVERDTLKNLKIRYFDMKSKMRKARNQFRNKEREYDRGQKRNL